VALTDAGRQKHMQRQQQLTETLQQIFADYDAAALDSAAVALDRLAAIYDEL
jgi:hypothetical protein